MANLPLQADRAGESYSDVMLRLAGEGAPPPLV